MKESTIFILLSVCFSVLTICAVITNAPIFGCAAICLTGVITLGFGFYNLANYN